MVAKNDYDAADFILQMAFVGGIALVGYLTYSFFQSLMPPPRVSPTLEDIYRVESHNKDLSPYNMTNVGISIDATVVDRSSWEAWWLLYFDQIPMLFTTGQNILYLEYGKDITVTDEAYKRAKIGDRVIQWHYITDGDFNPNRYDIYRNDILIYRKISIFDYLKP